MDAVRNRVLVVERLAAGVHDGGAVEQGDVAFAAREETETRRRRSVGLSRERERAAVRVTAAFLKNHSGVTPTILTFRHRVFFLF